MKKSILLSAAMGITFAFNAQIKAPQPSPESTVKQAVGLTDVTVTYSRPSAKGRKVFGELVPMNEMWRTGANASTKITFSEPVKIEGNAVPAGQYALYAIPGAQEWTIVLHKNLTLWGTGGYNEAEDLLRVKVKPVAKQDFVETFTIDFSDFTATSAHLNLIWENTEVPVKIETNTDELMEKQIKAQLVDGPSAGTYAAAANYYLEKNVQLDQAIAWIDKAIEKRPEAFWYMHTKAKIQAKQGKKKEAIATAQKSMELAKANKEGDFGYVLNNQKLIEELNKK